MTWFLNGKNFLRNFPIDREPYLQARVDEWAIQRPKHRGSNEMLLDANELADPSLKVQADHNRHSLRWNLNRVGSSMRMFDATGVLFKICQAGPDLWETRSASDAVITSLYMKRMAVSVRNEQRGLDRLARGIDASDPADAIFLDYINSQKLILNNHWERVKFEAQLYERNCEDNLERIRGRITGNETLIGQLSIPKRRVLGLLPPPEFNGDDDENGNGENEE